MDVGGWGTCGAVGFEREGVVMETKDLIKYGLFAAAAYYVWDKFGPSLGLPAAPSLFTGSNANALPAGSTPTTSGSTTTGSTPTVSSDLKTLMMAAAAKNNFGTVASADEWGWLYASKDVRGVPAPDPTTITDWPNGSGADPNWQRGFQMSLDQYIASTGLKGIQRFKYDPAYLKKSLPLNVKGGSRIANG